MAEDNSRLYILAGGGSGGHLYPGLAVGEALRELEPSSEVLFLATEREIDKRILDGSGFGYITQPIRPLPSWRKGREIWGFWRSWRASLRRCREVMGEKRPRAVLGLGGFASGPALKAAAGLGIPTALLNPDAVPGRANRFGRRFARRIFLQWDTSRRYFAKDGDKCVVTGCPIRRFLIEGLRGRGEGRGAREEARRGLGLEEGKKALVVMGGSQGGHNVNMAAVEGLTGQDIRLDGWQVLHLTGYKDKEYAEGKYRGASVTARVLEFTERMDLVLGGADLVIGRGGASSLAELTAGGVPSILLPYPYHKDQHQLRNAEVLAEAGAARIVKDDGDAHSTAKSLSRELQEVMQEPKLREMSQAAGRIARPEAAKAVAEELTRLVVMVG